MASFVFKDFATMLKELNQAREQLLEKDEEISELKSERCNTRVSMRQCILKEFTSTKLIPYLGYSTEKLRKEPSK